MSAAVIQRSIEALYQEAEAAVHDGQPMLTIIQSFAPTTDTSHLTIVAGAATVTADTSSDMVASGTVNAERAAVWRRIEDLLDEAEAISAPSAIPNVEGEAGAENEERDEREISDGDIATPVTETPVTEVAVTEVAVTETPVAEAPITEAPAEPTATATPQMMPAEPPAPDHVDGADALNDTDITALLSEAKDETTETTETASATDPASYVEQTDDDIDTVMADIAAAVGVVEHGSNNATLAPTAKPAVATDPIAPETSTQQASDQQASDHEASDHEASDLQATDHMGAPQRAPIAVASSELAAFIGDTVRTVLAEELPAMVKQAVTDALRNTKGNTETAYTETAPKKAAPKKTATKKTATKKTGAKKTGAKKPGAVTAKVTATVAAKTKQAPKAKAKAAKASKKSAAKK